MTAEPEQTGVSTIITVHERYDLMLELFRGSKVGFIDFNQRLCVFGFVSQLHQRLIADEGNFAFICTGGRIRSVIGANIALGAGYDVSAVQDKQVGEIQDYGISIDEFDALIESGEIDFEDGKLILSGMTLPITHIVLFIDSRDGQDTKKVSMLLNLITKLRQKGYTNLKGFHVIFVVATEQETQRAMQLVENGGIMEFSA